MIVLTGTMLDINEKQFSSQVYERHFWSMDTNYTASEEDSSDGQVHKLEVNVLPKSSPVVFSAE